MSTVLGTIRSFNAVLRQAERTRQQQVKQATLQFKKIQIANTFANTGQAVNSWNEYVEILKSFHKNCSNSINWDRYKAEPKPVEPVKTNANEQIAIFNLNNFQPTFLDKIFFQTKRKANVLNRQVKEAKAADQARYKNACQQYAITLKNWETIQHIAEGIERKDVNAYKEAIEYFEPFSEISEIGSRYSILFHEDFADISLYVKDEQVIPDFELSQTTTGKLSKKKMVKTRFNELYQDYICSCVLRVARELFAYLPVTYVRINAMAYLLNSKNGYIEEQPILSVIIPFDSLAKLKLNSIDPSDSMKNFIHHMDFKKTSGFDAVEPVDLLN